MPASIEGQAALLAIQACIRGGMTGPEIDMAGALELARAYGADPAVAAPLISAAFAGVVAGVKAARDKPE